MNPMGGRPNASPSVGIALSGRPLPGDIASQEEREAKYTSNHANAAGTVKRPKHLAVHTRRKGRVPGARQATVSYPNVWRNVVKIAGDVLPGY